MATVAGVLLDHVHQDPTQVDARRADWRRWRADRGRWRRRSPPGCAPRQLRTSTAAARERRRRPSRAPSRDRPSSRRDAHGSRAGSPAQTSLNHCSSTSVMCLSRPPNVSVDGARRIASWAWVRPDRFAQQDRPVIVEHGDQRVAFVPGGRRLICQLDRADHSVFVRFRALTAVTFVEKCICPGRSGEYRHMSKGLRD